MASDLVTIGIGRVPTQVSGAPLADGTIIKNTDSLNSVWVSNNNSVTPGNGVEIGPLATANWGKNGLCFAVVDTGVTTAIILQVSNDVTSLDDPVAIASATAAALLAGGIPNVLVSTVIVAHETQLVGGTNTYDVSSFASVQLVPLNPGLIYPNIPWGINYSFNTRDGKVITEDSFGNQVSIPQASLSLRVDGPLLFIQNQSATNSIDYELYGSNRPQTLRSQSSRDSNLGSHSQVPVNALGNYVINTPLYNGLCYARFAITTTVQQGLFQLIASDGEVITLCDYGEMVTSVGQKTASKLIALPVSPYTLRYVSQVAGAATAVVDLIPVNS